MKIRSKHRAVVIIAAALAVGGVAGPAGAADGAAKAKAPATSKEVIERGRYLVTVGNCNDCHTANFPPLDGKEAWSLFPLISVANLRLVWHELSG